ncbi:MAG: cysteine desulfurase family protein [Actinomycetes bacterium]
MDEPVYLDHNATTPVDPRVVDAMQEPLREAFGNPSSAHRFGERARGLLDDGRARLAALLGAASDEVVLTGSGSEADALAVRGAVLARSDVARPHVVTQVTEHPAVLAACARLQRHHGTEVSYLPVDRFGRVDPADVAAALRPSTVLVSVMHANNETGTLQPVREIAAVTRERGVLLHTDAAQTVGRVPVDVEALGVDLLTVVGHKIYAPKGIGALYVRRGVRLEALVGGGGQEQGLRAGTENVAGAVALGVAADLAAAALAGGEPARLAGLRDALLAALERRLPGRVHLHGHPVDRLPNTLNVRFSGVAGRDVLAAAPDVAASTGSACHATDDAPSTGLMALGLSPDQAEGAVRLSLGRGTTAADVERAVDALVAAVLPRGRDR